MTPSRGSNSLTEKEARAERDRDALRQVAPAKEHALAQIEHLRRTIDYDYPQRAVQEQRTVTERAVNDYVRAQGEAGMR